MLMDKTISGALQKKPEDEVLDVSKKLGEFVQEHLGQYMSDDALDEFELLVGEAARVTSNVDFINPSPDVAKGLDDIEDRLSLMSGNGPEAKDIVDSIYYPQAEPDISMDLGVPSPV